MLIQSKLQNSTYQKQSWFVYYMSNRKIRDLHKLNPNWKLAHDHGKASKPGIPLQIKTRMSTFLLCPCCLNIIQKQPVSLWQNSKELFFLGHGFPLFYNMLQFCIILIFLLIISSSSLSIYHAINQDCFTKQHNVPDFRKNNIPNACDSFFVKISKSSHQAPQNDEIIVRVVSFVVLLIAILYFRDSQLKLAGYHKERDHKISDYSVIIKNLPFKKGIKKSLQTFFKQCFPPSQQEDAKIIEPYEIILMPDLKQFYEIQHKQFGITKKKKKLIDYKDIYKQQWDQLEIELNKINIDLSKLSHQFQQKAEKDDVEVDKAIVIFKTQNQKQRVIREFAQMDRCVLTDYFQQNAYELTLKQAPQPKQIIWQNSDYPKRKRWIRIFFGWVLFFFFLALVTVIFFFLILAKSILFESSLHHVTQDQDKYQNQYRGAIILVYATILLVQLFNKFVMKKFLHFFCDLEKPLTSSQLQFSYAFKYTLGMFFTTAIMTLAVQAIYFNNYTNQYGVVEQQTIIFFFNAFFVAFLWILHPQYYMQKILRYFYMGSKKLTQKQANQLMEDYPYDMGKRYAQILETIWFTFLYSSLIPIGPFITLIGLSLYYCIDKYNLLRRSKLNNTIQSKLPLLAIFIMQLVAVLKPLGQLIFDLQLRNVVLPSTIVELSIGTIFVFIPWNILLKYLFQQKFKKKQQNFQQISHLFNESYKTLNPLQRIANINLFINRSKNRIDIQLYKDDHKNMGLETIAKFFNNGNKFHNQQQNSKQLIKQSTIIGSDFKWSTDISSKVFDPNSKLQISLNVNQEYLQTQEAIYDKNQQDY